MPSLPELLHGENQPRIVRIAVLLAFVAVFYFALRLVVWGAGKRVAARAKKTATLVDDLLTDLLRATRGYSLLAISLYVGSVFAPISDRAHALTAKGLVFVLLFQSLTWSKIAIDFWIEKVLRKKSDRDAGSATTIGLISFAVRAAAFAVIVLLALNNMGIEVTALVAGLGVGGVAVALALQNILGDLFASLTIILDKPFIAGDFIVVGDFMGSIEHIGLKTTRLRSLSGEQLIFANGDLLQSRIRNYKRMAERRVASNITVTYRTPEAKLRRIPEIVKTAVESRNAERNQVRFDRCHFLEFQDSALRFELVYWVLSADFNVYADIAQEINLRIFAEFGKTGIEFAHPTRTVYNVASPAERADALPERTP